MTDKSYNTPENEPLFVSEPAMAYRTATSENISSGEWNPNVPFHGTQEEWWEHFHRIEEGNFEPWEEHQKKFYAWKEKYLISQHYT